MIKQMMLPWINVTLTGMRKRQKHHNEDILEKRYCQGVWLDAGKERLYTSRDKQLCWWSIQTMGERHHVGNSAINKDWLQSQIDPWKVVVSAQSTCSVTRFLMNGALNNILKWALKNYKWPPLEERKIAVKGQGWIWYRMGSLKGCWFLLLSFPCYHRD